jgi:hypothetical protein
MAEEQSRDELELAAENARLKGRESEALDLFEAVIRRDLRDGRIAKAVSVYQRIVLWNPGSVELHHRLAQAIADARDGIAEAHPVPPAIPQSPLFAGIGREELPEILNRMTPARFGAGETIVEEGEPGESLYLITEGTVTVRTRDDGGEDVELAELSAGDFFGEVSLLTRRPRTATVISRTAVGVLELSRQGCDAVRRRFPDIDRALTEFHRLRAEKTVEALIDRRRKR